MKPYLVLVGLIIIGWVDLVRVLRLNVVSVEDCVVEESLHVEADCVVCLVYLGCCGGRAGQRVVLGVGKELGLFYGVGEGELVLGDELGV